MPSHSELIKADAVTIVDLLQRGEVTPHDLLDALEARIAAVDGSQLLVSRRCQSPDLGSYGVAYFGVCQVFRQLCTDSLFDPGAR